MKFTQEEIQRIVSNQNNYQLIQRMMNYNIVDRMVINKNQSFEYEIFANISSNSRKHTCNLVCTSANHIISYDCNCSYCTESSGCAHIGVVLELINQLDPKHYPFYYQAERAFDYSSYIQGVRLRQQLSFSQQYIQDQKAQPLVIQNASSDRVSLSAYIKQQGHYKDNRYYVAFRIGTTRKYIVKNLKTLMKDSVTQTYRQYGKNFGMTHHKDMFAGDSLVAFNFIQDAVLLQSENPSFNTKEILLEGATIDLFYDAFSRHPQGINAEFKEMSLTEAKIMLQSTTDGTYIEISRKKNSGAILGKKGLYHIETSPVSEAYRILKYDIQGNSEVIDFLQMLDGQSLVLNESMLFDFNRYVYHNIRNYFTIDGTDFAQVRFDNRIELFGDLNEQEQVIFTIKAYDDDALTNETFSVNATSSLHFIRIYELMTQYGGIVVESSTTMTFSLSAPDTLRFLQDGLEAIRKIATIYISESLRRISLNTARTIRVGLSFSNNLLSVDLESDDIPKDELGDVLSAYRRKKKFYRLKNGEMILINDQDFEEVHDFLEHLGQKADDLDDGRLLVNPYRIFTLDALSESYASFAVTKSNSFLSQLQAIQTIDPSRFTVPATINAALRTYQIEGYQWLSTLNHYGLGGILADDMGLGKTLQMITYFAGRALSQPSLVVCPSSVLLNWEQEILKFSDNLSVLTISGTKQARLALIRDARQFDIVVISYDYLRHDIEIMKTIEFACVVLDEAQYIKNHNTKNAKAVKQLQAKQRFALTGTPIENSLAELWSIFDFLMPGYLYGYSYFRTHFETPIIKQQDETTSKQLKDLLKPFILRRLKSDVLTDLPEKTEVNMIIEFSPEEKKLYYANLAQVNRDLEALIQQEKGAEIQILAMLTRLRRLCCEPRTIYDNITHRSSKMEAVVRFISDLKESGKKILLFSSFTSVLDLVAQELQQESITYRIIDGSVDKEKRQQRIREFQAGAVDVFLISLRAGGTGINLTAAEVVIHFDPWWNISAQNQATDRAYRIGQTNNVLVYKFIMKGSIEEKIQTLQEKKKQLSDTFVEDSDGSISIMDKDAIISLFGMDQH